MANSFIPAITCPICDNLVEGDATFDLTCDEGVVNLELFAQREFECKKCGTHIYTGDISDFTLVIDKNGNEVVDSSLEDLLNAMKEEDEDGEI